MAALPQIQTPTFAHSVIQADRTDGYWVETFFIDRKDKFPSLIGYGLVTGEICIFDNPRNLSKTPIQPGDPEPAWPRYLIANLSSPVAACPADCAGNGQKDILITHEYGATFLDTDPKGGLLSWLENPGRGEDGKVKEGWKRRFIGRWPSMHRLQAGRFTQRAFLEIVALPITHGPFDVETPIPIFLYTRNAVSLDEVEWKTEVIDDNYFTLIHECTIKTFEGHEGLQSMLIASREGVNLLYYDTKSHSWRRDLINPGMPKVPGKLPAYYGSACVNSARVGNDPAAFMFTVDPFHGGTVAAYTKRETGPGTHVWVRHVLDVYGDPKQRLDGGDGPGHHIAVGDFDGDGDEECLVAFFGPNPCKGVWYYKAVDLDRGIFAKWKVANESAARIAVGHFTGNPNALDFATIGYNVPLYYEERHPQLNLYRHTFPLSPLTSTSTTKTIIAALWDAEPIYHLPHPTKLASPITLKVLTIAGYDVSIEVFPPGYSRDIPPTEITLGEAVKVVYGSVKVAERQFASPVVSKNPKPGKLSRDLRVVPEGERDGRAHPFSVGAKGAVVLRFKRTKHTSQGAGDRREEYPTAESVQVTSHFRPTYPVLKVPGVQVRTVTTEEWVDDEDVLGSGTAEEGGVGEGGMKGFSRFWGAGMVLRFFEAVGADPQKEICAVRFYSVARDGTSGTKPYAKTPYLATHLSLSSATGTGSGIWAVKPGTVYPPGSPLSLERNKLPEEAYDKIPLQPMQETVGLWERGEDGRPVVRTDDGPVDGQGGGRGGFVHPDWRWQSGKGGEGVDVFAQVEFNWKLL